MSVNFLLKNIHGRELCLIIQILFHKRETVYSNLIQKVTLCTCGYIENMPVLSTYDLDLLYLLRNHLCYGR